MDVTIKLEGFEGPLDLLLHLIEQAELDVCDVPIARITDQYMAYLSAMREWELEIASGFSVMAADPAGDQKPYAPSPNRSGGGGSAG